MDIFSLIMVFLDGTWKLSIILSKYVILIALGYSLWINKKSLEEPINYIKDVICSSFGESLIFIGSPFVFGFLSAGLISIFYKSSIIIYSVFFVVSLSLLAVKMSSRKIKGSENNSYLHLGFSIVFLSILIASIFSYNSLIDEIVALIFYGVIFWRI